jgi:hypothetical protein
MAHPGQSARQLSHARDGPIAVGSVEGRVEFDLEELLGHRPSALSRRQVVAGADDCLFVDEHCPLHVADAPVQLDHGGEGQAGAGRPR